MERILTNKLENKMNEDVLIKGWIHRIKVMKNISFLILRDREGLVQCVVDKDVEWIKHVRLESIVSVIGVVKEGKNKYKNLEVEVKEIELVNEAVEELPIEINKDKLDISLDTMLNNRMLSLRHESKKEIIRIGNLILKSFRDFLIEQGFTEIITPKIVGEGAEGGTEVFKVDYFGKKAYLAQSPQFYKQMMVIAGFERVFEIGTFFRAEEHDTKRHLNQFVSMDLEMAFIEDENDLMDLEEKMLNYIFDVLGKEAVKGFEALGLETPKIETRFPRLDMEEVKDILKRKYNKELLEKDLDTEAEKLLGRYIKEKYKSDFVFVTNYGKKKRPMYTMPKGESGTHSFDLIYKGTEITSGAQRIHDYNMLLQSFKEKNLDVSSFESYINSFKYGVPPHGGLAIGFERLVAQILDLDNVREVTLFTRDKNRMIP